MVKFEPGQTVYFVGRGVTGGPHVVKETTFRQMVGGSSVFCYVDDGKKDCRRPLQRRVDRLYATQAEAEAELPKARRVSVKRCKDGERR